MSKINEVDTETNVKPDVTPLDGAAEYEKELTTLKENYDKLSANYTKVVRAFNLLLEEYNALHVEALLNKSDEKVSK